MGESQKQPFQLSFNTFLRVDFQGSRVTSTAVCCSFANSMNASA